MFRTLLFSAFGAGIAVCIAVSAMQAATTQPLLLHAEEFENAGADVVAAAPAADVAAGAVAAVAHEHEVGAAAHSHDEEEWAPSDGVERTLYTAAANLVVGTAVALILLALMTLSGRRIDARQGLLWGAGGFLAVALLPALGLPPELPGTPAADIFARQAWWLTTAAASAAGLGLLAFGRGWAFWAPGIALIVLPHIVGAPESPSLEAAYPAVLAGEFVTASLAVSALLWLLAGLASGWLHQRLSQPAVIARPA